MRGFPGHVGRNGEDERGDVLEREGLDPRGLARDVRECPESTALLRRFAELVDAWESEEPG